MDDLIVGNSDCSYNSVWKIFITNGTKLSVGQWQEFALMLEIPTEWIKQRKSQIQLDIVTLRCAIRETLETWRSQNGNKASLRCLVDVLKHLELNQIAENLETHFIRNSNEKSVSIKRIPPRSSYYINRRLIGRYNIDLSILQTKCNDLFLIVGIERLKLRTLIPKNSLTGTSQEYLQSDPTENPTKHLTLSLKTDFENIKSRTKHPVHVLEYANSHLKWIQSAGSIEVVLQHILPNQVEMDEEKVLEELMERTKHSKEFASSPVVISDTPGMGKSYLLQNIARHFEDNHPDKMVVLLNISEVANTLDLNDNSEELVLKWLAKICEMSFEELIIILGKNRPNTKIELFLDGFDETSEDKIDMVTQLLIKLRSLSGIRVWLTTRPHHLNHLETIFQVAGYNIAPFTADDQINFLEGFWSETDEVLSSEKLREFGKECLRVLNENTPGDHTEFSGIPLQCFLVAEVYQKHAYEFAQEENQVCKENVTPTIPTYTIVDLYEKLVEKKLEIYKQRHCSVNCNFSFDDVIKCHMAMALDILFPDLNLNDLEFKKVSRSELLNIGLLVHTKLSYNPQFIHRTFAEYFAALSLCYLLKEMRVNNFPDNLFMSIFRFSNCEVVFLWKGRFRSYLQSYPAMIKSFTNKVIVYIIDNLFAKQKYSNLSLPNLSFDIAKQLIEACVENNCLRLLKWVSSDKSIAEHQNKAEVFNLTLFAVSVSISKLDVVKFVLNIFNNLHSEEDRNLMYRDREKVSLLQIAAGRGVYSVFELLASQPTLRLIIEECHLKTRGLVHLCARYSYVGRVDERIDILRLLFQINDQFIAREFIYEMNDYPATAFSKVSIDLLKEMIKLAFAGSWRQLGKQKELLFCVSLLLSNSFHLSSEDYHKLLTHTLSVLESNLIPQIGWGEVFLKIRSVINFLPETLETFARLDVNI